MGKIECLALDDLRLDVGPCLCLGGVREQIHDDGTAADGLVQLKKVLAGNPAILYGIPPRLAVLSDANNNIEAVVAQVETLSVSLGAVANKGEGVVFEVFLRRIRVSELPKIGRGSRI